MWGEEKRRTRGIRSQESEVRRDRDGEERQGRDALIPPVAGPLDAGEGCFLLPGRMTG